MAWIDPGTAVESAMSSVASAGLLTYLIEWLKKSSLVPFITADKKTLLRWLNALSAAALAVGLHWAYDPDARQLVIDIPTIGTVVAGLWAWGQQWALQQMAYDGVVAKSTGASREARPRTRRGAGVHGLCDGARRGRRRHPSLHRGDAGHGQRHCDAQLQTAESCRAFNVKLVPVIASAKTFNRAVRENSAAEIPAMLSALAGLREAVGSFFPPDMVAQLRARLDAAYGLVVKLGVADGRQHAAGDGLDASGGRPVPTPIVRQMLVPMLKAVLPPLGVTPEQIATLDAHYADLTAREAEAVRRSRATDEDDSA